IAIIAILIGLLIPAVQKVREAASRIKCANNLRQLGLALHNFHDAHDGFPPGASETQMNGKVITHGWVPHILTYLEQGNIPYRFDVSWNSSVNDNSAGPGPGRTFLNILVC